MRRILMVAVALFASGLIRTPVAAAPVAAASNYTDPAIAREINEVGFRAWASQDDPHGVRDAAVSPLAIWYLNQFTNLGWAKRGPEVASTLKALAKDAGFSAMISVNRGRVRFGEGNVKTAARLWGASTRWLPPAGYDIRVDVSLKQAFDFSIRPRRARVPFFHEFGLRSIRLDSSNGRTSIYLVQGSEERLSAFKVTLSEQGWKSFTSGFRDTEIDLDDISLSRVSSAEISSESSSLFGTEVTPRTGAQHAIFGNQTFDLTNVGGEASVAMAIQGKVIAPPITHRLSNETTVTVYHLPDTVNYDPAAGAPIQRQFSLVQPMIYIVVDRLTGVVLLIGMHG